MSETGLPRGWASTTLKEVADVQGGLAKGKKRSSGDVLQSVPYLRVANVQRGHLDLSDVREILATEEEVNRLRLEPGDVLFNEGGDRDKLGRGWVWRGQIPRCIHQNHVFRARLLSPGISSELVSWYANTFGQQYFFGEGRQTVNLASLSKSKLMDLPLLLPPAGEQSRILAALDSYITRIGQADAGLKRVQRNLKRYRASVLQAAVEGRLVPTEAELARAEGRDYEPASELLKRILTERRRRWEETELARLKSKGKPPTDDRWKAKYSAPAEPDLEGLPDLPEGWTWASLEQLSSGVRVICYGILMPKEHVPDGVPYVKVRDMKGNRLDVEALSRTSPAIAAQYSRASLRQGDLLLAIRGTYGRVVKVPPDLEGGNITQDTARIELNGALHRGYIRTYLLSPDAQNFFKRVARGVAVKGVNIADVRRTPVSIPPIAEQERILKESDRHMSVLDELEHVVSAASLRSGRLRQGVLAWAFQGKLADQDPADEPATQLLDRIRKARAAERPAEKGTRRSRRKRT